jgi:hypothetical protein
MVMFNLRLHVKMSVIAVGLLLISACISCMSTWRWRIITAKASLREIEIAESSYKSAKGRYGTLPELAAAGLITGDMAQGKGDAYRYEVRLKGESYEARAIPDKAVDKELPAYYLDASGVLRHNFERTEADATDQQAPET